VVEEDEDKDVLVNKHGTSCEEADDILSDALRLTLLDHDRISEV